MLYGKGKKDFLNKSNKLAVVGTREPTLYGQESLEFILHPLLERGWLIVSGFARGIDTMSHEITVRLHCPTIAILGHGLSYIYPKENRYLYEAWNEYILLLTEYPPHYAPKKWYFPKRNRIISGISKGVLVVEAKSRSGTLITADLALEQNRSICTSWTYIYRECIRNESSNSTRSETSKKCRRYPRRDVKLTLYFYVFIKQLLTNGR